MEIKDKLNLKENKKLYKTINIEDKLYEKLAEIKKRKYDASISEIIDIAIEMYIDKNEITFYRRERNQSVTYRNISIRTKNVENLKKLSKQTGLSVTRLVNYAIKTFIDNEKK